jgi:hypothetical protein
MNRTNQYQRRFALCVFTVAVIGLVNRMCSAQPMADSPALVAQWGAEALDATKRDLWLADLALHAEKKGVDDGGPLQPAFLWPAGVQLSALAAAAEFDSAVYTGPLVQYADALKKYWTESEGIGGYSVLPDQPSADRYYDDNAWIVLGLIETHAVTRDAQYLERAKVAMQFVLSGEDEVLGGGIYWRERPRRSKNTCSNAPAIVGALRLYQACADPQYMTTAERLYNWTRANLQDEDDGPPIIRH